MQASHAIDGVFPVKLIVTTSVVAPDVTKALKALIRRLLFGPVNKLVVIEVNVRPPPEILETVAASAVACEDPTKQR